MKERVRKKEIGKRRACKEEERNALGEQEEERTCCHQKKESCCCCECSSYKETHHKKFFDHFYYNNFYYYVVCFQICYSVCFLSFRSLVVSLVLSLLWCHLCLALLTMLSQKDKTFSSQEKPDLDTEDCECSFCYEPHCKDGKEWLECTCGRWVHEHCLEDIIVHKGQEQFCPFCIN